MKIQKGAKSISILEPVEYAKKDGTTGISYNVKKVFDVSQTNGKRPPAPTVNRDPKALITVMLDSSRLKWKQQMSFRIPIWRRFITTRNRPCM